MVTKAAPYTCMYLSVSWSLPLSKPNKSLQVLPPDWQLWRATRAGAALCFSQHQYHWRNFITRLCFVSFYFSANTSPYCIEQEELQKQSELLVVFASFQLWMLVCRCGWVVHQISPSLVFLLCIHLVVQKRHLCAWSTGSLEFGSFQLWTSVGCRGDQLVTRGRPTSLLYLLTFLWRTRLRQNMRSRNTWNKITKIP